MNIALSNILPILLALVCGLEFRRLKIALSDKTLGLLSNICLYLLLVFMGVTVGNIPNIVSKLLDVGKMALLIASLVSLCTALAVWLAMRVVRGRRIDDGVNHGAVPSHGSFDLYAYVKDPVQLLGLVVLGFLLAYFGVMPLLDYDAVVTVLLYGLIFIIGIKLSLSNIRWRDIVLNKLAMLIAAATLLGTYAGAVLAATLIDLPYKDTLAASSGFGWYTLSGIMLTQMGNPVLGSVAFLSDLFREVFALLLIPVLCKTSGAPVAIGVCGATCMDVTLPVIEKHASEHDTLVAFISGAIITVAVPFLIPFFYSL